MPGPLCGSEAPASSDKELAKEHNSNGGGGVVFNTVEELKTKLQQQQQQSSTTTTPSTNNREDKIEEQRKEDKDLSSKEHKDKEKSDLSGGGDNLDNTMIPETQRSASHIPPAPLLSEDGLIIPRKPHNPVLDNAERQNLHKELLFNKKIGKNVLNQKSELQKALAKHKDNVAKKELESSIAANTPELEKVIADRAKKLQEVSIEPEEDKVLSKEFLQARAKLRNRTSSK